MFTEAIGASKTRESEVYAIQEIRLIPDCRAAGMFDRLGRVRRRRVFVVVRFDHGDYDHYNDNNN